MFIHRFFICRNEVILLGGLQFGQSMKHYKSTQPYLSDDITWCVQAAQPVPMWLMIFFTFSQFYVLLVPLSAFFFLAAISWIYAGLDGSRMDFYSNMFFMFTVVIGFPVYPEPIDTIGKVFLFLSNFFGMILNVIFLSIHTSFLSVPLRFHQVHSVGDLIEQKFNLLGTNESLLSLLDSQKVRIKKYNRFNARKINMFSFADSGRIFE